jgi:hypothetical protein
LPGLSVARSNLLPLAAVAAVLGIGAAVVVAPLLALAVTAASASVMLLAPSRTRLPRLYLAVLAGLLGGYLLCGRGFAYLQVGPVFIGEIVLALGILVLALRPPRAAPVPAGAAVLLGLLGLFMLWSLAATAPHLSSDGAVALRDAALWGYATFALLVVTFLDRRQLLERASAWFRAVIPAYLLWVVLTDLLLPSLSGRLPLLGGGRVPLIELKPGDVGAHLAGIGAFMMLGLHRPAGAGAPGRHRLWPEPLVWVLWSIDFALVAARNRGGGLAILAALAAVALATRAWPLAKPASAAIVLLLIVTLFNLRVGPAGNREVSVSQLRANFSSIVDDTGQAELAGSRRWRLAWWRRIVDYTVHGPYFWAGKGYGVNLADDDGFQVTRDHSLRSPHNVNLTLLARSGVPGLVLWLVLQLAFAGRLLVVGRRARRSGDWWLAGVCAWVLAYWVAMQCNAAFDVYLEGPQGGIWFWSLFGVGLAVGTAPAAPPSATRLHEASA